MLVLYCFLNAIALLQVVLYFDVNNGSDLDSAGGWQALPNCLEPALIVLTAAGCLWCGLRLHRRVVQVQFGLELQRAILVRLVVSMAVIVVCYLTRALLVLSLADPMPRAYRLAMKLSYFEWLVGTRWLPYIVCSFFLSSCMCQSGRQLAQSRAAREALSPPPSRCSWQWPRRQPQLGRSSEDGTSTEGEWDGNGSCGEETEDERSFSGSVSQLLRGSYRRMERLLRGLVLPHSADSPRQSLLSTDTDTHSRTSSLSPLLSRDLSRPLSAAES
jgi:hypothetical protein